MLKTTITKRLQDTVKTHKNNEYLNKKDTKQSRYNNAQKTQTKRQNSNNKNNPNNIKPKHKK